MTRAQVEIPMLAMFERDAFNYEATRDHVAAQLDSHAEAMTVTQGNLDAEDETLRRLTALRAASAGQMTDARADVGALRATIAQVFAAFWVVADPYNAGGFVVLPEVRLGKRDERVPITFGVDPTESAHNQHGTELWKYMTQNTFRLA